MERTYSLGSEGGIVKLVCHECGFTDEIEFDIPESKEPKPAEAKVVLAPPNLSVKAARSEPSPVSLEELKGFIDKEFPKTVMVNNIPLEFRSQRMASDGIVGMEASYWIIANGRGEKICWDVLWCSDGIPEMAETMEYLLKQAESALSPNKPIRKVVLPATRQAVTISGDLVGDASVGGRFSQRLPSVSAPSGSGEGVGDGSPGLSEYLKQWKK
jgi:hypothetical protein